MRLAIAIAFLAGCSSGSSEAPVVDSTPLFERDIVPLFEKSCGASDSGCHSRVAFHPNPKEGCRGWLSLENAALGSIQPAGPDMGKPTGCPDVELYERLTKLDAWECGPPYFAGFPSRKYVEPGKPDASHLFNKLGGAQCGIPNVMPKGGTIAPADKEILRKWILAGAPRVKK